MTPQYYYWNPDAADPDDGGSVICPEGRTGKGRWLMIPQRVVDVRAFGVKPSQQTETATVTGNMAAAFNFANRYNRDLWFPKVYSYYAFGGGNLLLANNSLLVDNCVQFIPFAGSTKIVVKDIKKERPLQDSFTAQSGFLAVLLMTRTTPSHLQIASCSRSVGSPRVVKKVCNFIDILHSFSTYI